MVTPYSVPFDGFNHTATGSATGVLGESLSGLDLVGTTTHSAVGTYADTWTFTDSTGNYNNASAPISDVIGQAGSTTVVTFEAGPYTYRGTPFGATALVTGAGGLSQSVPVGFSTRKTSRNTSTMCATYSSGVGSSPSWSECP